MSLRVLVTGADGQLGQALRETAPAGISLSARTIEQLDITCEDSVRGACSEFGPDVIVNAAAYTAVDRAEEEPEAAWAVNCDGVRHLARAADEGSARLVQISTDFVFDGAQRRPYRPGDVPRPLCVYGASKLGGENAAREHAGTGWLILRTAWVYAADHRNFVTTMLGLMQQGKGPGVVADQTGTPTWAPGLARAIWRAVERDVTGLHHWTDAGVASWYDFAVAVREEALKLGLLGRPVEIKPIRTKDYPALAHRPRYSVLDKTATLEALGLAPVHWRENLRTMLRTLSNQTATHKRQGIS